MIVVVVAAAFTVCDALAEVLVAKLVSPVYTADRVSDPLAGNVIEHVPSTTVAVQVSPKPSLIVTLPAGVPLPGATAATVKLIVTAWPTTDGSGLSLVIVVVVEAWLTVCANAEEVLPVKFASVP